MSAEARRVEGHAALYARFNQAHEASLRALTPAEQLLELDRMETLLDALKQLHRSPPPQRTLRPPPLLRGLGEDAERAEHGRSESPEDA